MKWQSIAPGRTFEDGGELLVFYSQGSGSTHLINQAAAFILDLLAVCPRSTEELLQEMGAQVDDVPGEQMQEMLESLLKDLQRSELVEAV